MDLMQLAIVIIVVGVLLWLATTFIPMDGNIKQILVAVVVIALVLWILSLFVGIPHIWVGRHG